MYTSTEEYRPKGEWHRYDFEINKLYWKKKGFSSAESTRIANLKDVATTLDESGLSFWIFGQTLGGVVNEKRLLDDHDDDFGVFEESRQLILSTVKVALEKKRFTLIRSNERMASFARDYRYLDICFFRTRNDGKCGYGRKWFRKDHFETTCRVDWAGYPFPVPTRSQELLAEMYSSPSSTEPPRFHLLRSLYRRVKAQLRGIREGAPRYCSKGLPLAPIAKTTLRALGRRWCLLSKEAYLDLLIEPEDSFNWRWRARHLGVVTHDGKHRRIRDILNYLHSPRNRENIENSIVESDTSRPFLNPANLDMRFWWSGNNFFYYCVKFGFRESVTPYSEANAYIERNERPLLYSAEYYRVRSEIPEDKLARFLREHPIEVRNGAIISGKHRAFAMIGRLISGKDYLPMAALIHS